MEKDKKEITLLDIVEALERGFCVMATKEDVKKLDTRLDHLDASVATLQQDMQDVKKDVGDVKKDVEEVRENMVYRDEFNDVKDRVKYVEKKLGIKSGV